VLPEAYRLTTPCSPHRAAEIDGVVIDPARLAVPAVDPLVIEGAGGALVPVTRGTTYADVFAWWNLPTVIVARTELGTINHSLMTIEVLRARRAGAGRGLRGRWQRGQRGDDRGDGAGPAAGAAAAPGRTDGADGGRRLRHAFPHRGLPVSESPVWHPFWQHGLGEPVTRVTARKARRFIPPRAAA
jgi:hypothetical protein